MNTAIPVCGRCRGHGREMRGDPPTECPCSVCGGSGYLGWQRTAAGSQTTAPGPVAGAD